MTASFVLDPRLQEDTVFITALALSNLYLMNDKRWLWLILVPRIAGAEEMHRLSIKDQQQLCAETGLVAASVQEESGCDKINTAALANFKPIII